MVKSTSPGCARGSRTGKRQWTRGPRPQHCYLCSRGVMYGECSPVVQGAPESRHCRHHPLRHR